MIVVQGNFDPITETELQALKQLYRKTKQEIFVQLKEEAELGLAERCMLVCLALKPYRHLHLIAGYQGKLEDYTVYAEDEKQVREGRYAKAAYGTQKYIFDHGFYFQSTAKAMCNPHRYEHSLRVAETAREIALHQNVDPFLAYRAGLLHDITKAMSHEEGEHILKYYRPEWLAYSDKIWHSYTAVIWIQQNMACYDKAFLQAIAHHTLGDGHSKLSRIIYIADKIEPGRGYDTTRHMQLACHDLQACVQLIQTESAIYRKNKEDVHE